MERWCRGVVGAVTLTAVARAAGQRDTWRHGICAAHLDAWDRGWVVAASAVNARCQRAIPGPGRWVRVGGWVALVASRLVVRRGRTGAARALNWLLRLGSLAVLAGAWVDAPDARGSGKKTVFSGPFWRRSCA